MIFIERVKARIGYARIGVALLNDHDPSG